MSIQNQLNEAETRYNIIDPLVTKAGWDIADRRSVGFEIPVDGYDAAPINGITDYCLFRDNGEKLMHRYDAGQTRFLRKVQTVFDQKRRLKVGDLYEAPFTNFGLNAAEKLFNDDEVGEILEFTKMLSSRS